MLNGCGEKVNRLVTARPNLFIVGAPKCGTTAWVHYLSRHPDISFSPKKEPHYFSADFQNYRWVRSLSEYLDLFEGFNTKVVGEASVMYLFSQVAARGIAEFAPDAKVLIFLRAQRQFIPSFHQQMLYNLDENESDLGTAWNKSDQRTRACMSATCREPQFLNYKAVGNFFEQVARYYACFPQENIKVVSFREWAGNAREQYLEILEFLGVPDDGCREFPLVNPAHDHRSKALARLTQRPPGWARKASALVRKIPGLATTRPSHAIRAMNRTERYKSRPTDALLSEIDSYFRESNRRLENLVGREFFL